MKKNVTRNMDKKTFLQVVAEMASLDVKGREITSDGWHFIEVKVNGNPYISINMDIMYEGYQYCVDFGEIVQMVADLANGKDLGPTIEKIVVRYEIPEDKAKDDEDAEMDEAFKSFVLECAEVVLVNKDDKRISDGALTREVGDMRVIYVVKEDGSDTEHVVQSNALKVLNEEELYKAALVNIMKNHGNVSVKEHGFFSSLYIDDGEGSEYQYGAVSLMYPGLLEAISKDFDDDLYIAPVCPGAVFVVNASVLPAEMVNAMLAASNVNVAKGDKLTDTVYLYKRGSKEIKPFDDRYNSYRVG